MEKVFIFGAGIIVIISIILVVILQAPSLTGLSLSNPEQTQNAPDSHAWTKAICTKDHFCQDYLIECNGQEPIKLSPITGAAVQFESDWRDPRTLEQRQRLCD